MLEDKELTEEDKKALERYNNYVAGMKGKTNTHNNIIKDKKNDDDKEAKVPQKLRPNRIKIPDNATEEDKKAIDRYKKFVASQMKHKSKKKSIKENIFKKDISGVAWKIRLIFLVLAISFFVWALKDQIFR